MQRRSIQSANTPIASRPLRADIDPPPKPWPFAQFLAFVLILFLCFLQFLPATHFRDPSDPLRRWVPSRSNIFSSSDSRASGEGKSGNNSTHGKEDEVVHIVSWMECLDLRVLAVLANSTLSNSRYPGHVHFHFFTPDGQEDKVSYYKLKVLFPHSNLELLGQMEVKEYIKIASLKGEYVGPSLNEVAPFIIPIIHPSLSRFIYISPDTIVKGRIEELFRVDLANYAIAAAEDCTKTLQFHVNFDVLDAIQRSASKNWISEKPYEKNACTPDLKVLLIDVKNFKNDLLEAVLWWSKVLNRGRRNNKTNPAIVLALYNRYLKLPTSWRIGNSNSLNTSDERKILHFDGPKSICSEIAGWGVSKSEMGNTWKQYLPLMADQILGTQN